MPRLSERQLSQAGGHEVRREAGKIGQVSGLSILVAAATGTGTWPSQDDLRAKAKKEYPELADTGGPGAA